MREGCGGWMWGGGCGGGCMYLAACVKCHVRCKTYTVD